MVCFELIKLDANRPSSAHFGWSGSYSDESCATVSGIFAKELGFQDGDQVIIRLSETRVVRCRRAQIKPTSQHDWDAFEQYANEIEQHLMQQVRIIWSGMRLPVWVDNSRKCLSLNVGQIQPDSSLASLEMSTELERIRPEKSKQIKKKSFDDDDIEDDDDVKEKAADGLDVTCDQFKSSPSFWNRFMQTVTDLVDTSNTKIDSPDSTNELNSPRNKKQYLTLCQLPGLTPEVNSAKKQVFRVLPLEALPTQTTLINTVFINPAYAQPGVSLDQNFAARLIRLLSPNEQRAGKENFKNNSTDGGWMEEQDALSTVVRVQLISGLAMDSVGVCDGLRRQLGLFTNSRLLLELAKFEQVYDFSEGDRSSVEKRQKLPLAQSLTFTPVPLRMFEKPEEIREKLLRELRTHLRGHQLLLLSKGSLLRLENKDLIFTTDFEQEDAGSTVVLNASVLDTLEVRVLHESPKRRTRWGLELPFASVKDLETKFTLSSTFPQSEMQIALDDDNDDDDDEGTFQSNLSRLVKLANLGFVQSGHTPCLANLVCGASGSGKSFLVSALVQWIRKSRRQVHISRIDCHKLRGKRVEPLRKQLQSEIEESVYRQPSLLVIEDLDILLPNNSQIEDKQERLHVEKCALVFRRLLAQALNSQLLYGCRVCVVVTAKSPLDLHDSMFVGSGEHFFQEVIQLQPPNGEQRASILRGLISARLPASAIDWNQLKLETFVAPTICDGYLPADLHLIADKAIHCCIQKTKELAFAFRPELSAEHFEIASSDYVPLSLRGLKLRPASKFYLKHVGGLEQVKQTLVETLLWPTRFPSLFSQLPIRPQSSVLLYGAPGTGKTLLAEALANECGVRFVCVRGPELLSKYIGASEAAVRALFEKANQTGPCIVFFDEIDAIAPARGHDSTGVTDRVVNQILTQMDGIEQLNSGVHVLAATSRPDLVDRALLRPGRFDLSLYCPLPNLEDRQRILEVLISRLQDGGDCTTLITVDKEVSMENLAERTQNFSGADLQALVYNARLEAIHEHIRSSQSESTEKDVNLMLDEWSRANDKMISQDDLKELIITENNLVQALQNTRPSVGPAERAKYDQL